MRIELAVLPSDDHDSLSLESHSLPNHFGIVLEITDKELPCAFDCANFQISPPNAYYTIESLSILPQACLLRTAVSERLDVLYRCNSVQSNGSVSSFVSNRLRVLVSDKSGTNCIS